MPKEPYRHNRIVTAMLWLAIALCMLLAASHYFAAHSYVLDIAASLSYFAAVPLAVVAAGAAATRRPMVAATALICATLAATPLLIRIEWSERAAPHGSEATVLLMNVQGSPQAWSRLRDVIDRRTPDIVLVVEADPPIADLISADKALAAAYPFQVIPKPGMSWGQAILSRHPLTPVRPQGEVDRYRFLFTFHRAAFVDLPQGRIIVTVEHPPSPRRPQSWADGNRGIVSIGELIRNQFAATGVPVLLGGDFNTSPTGYRDTLLRKATGLHPDPFDGLPVGTWPCFFPRYLRLPLDRVWASEAIAFTGHEVLENVGSDHLPVLVRFQLRDRPPANSR